MSRDQRVRDNWALIHAQDRAIEMKRPLIVFFCLVPQFLNATIRQYSFMLKGLCEVQSGLNNLNIPFELSVGEPRYKLPEFMNKIKAAALVADFDPLKIKRRRLKDVTAKVDVPVSLVDAHNIVPVWEVSEKQEYAARTIRPKIHRLLDEFLDEFPKVKQHPYKIQRPGDIRWEDIFAGLEINRSVSEVAWLTPGEQAAKKMLNEFVDRKLELYPDTRNDPTKNGQSNLSAYLHFGQVSAQRVALKAAKSKTPARARENFLEELIVRRELSDNFCYYNDEYDSFAGFPAWARETLNKHRKDKRKPVYEPGRFEYAQTHDELWNAAQKEMVLTGKMHGYMRMYWAKKILEWSPSPEDALNTAIYLNDKYELDGRDPNGYTGIAWSIGAVHDRAWKERPVYGKIRYMSLAGAKRKFDVAAYVQKIRDLETGLG